MPYSSGDACDDVSRYLFVLFACWASIAHVDVILAPFACDVGPGLLPNL